MPLAGDFFGDDGNIASGKRAGNGDGQRGITVVVIEIDAAADEFADGKRGSEFGLDGWRRGGAGDGEFVGIRGAHHSGDAEEDDGDESAKQGEKAEDESWHEPLPVA